MVDNQSSQVRRSIPAGVWARVFAVAVLGEAAVLVAMGATMVIDRKENQINEMVKSCDKPPTTLTDTAFKVIACPMAIGIQLAR